MASRIALRFVALGAASAAVAGLAACATFGDESGDTARPSPVPCAERGGASRPTTARPTTRPLLAVVQPPNGAAILARFDPLSLRPVSRRVPIAEYHDAWSLSPDRSRVALGMSAPGRDGRIGILVVDLESMRVVRGIETGIAAEALAWVGPRVLVAALQRGGAVVVDPVTGNIVRRAPDLRSPQAATRTRDGLVMVAEGRRSAGARGASARLAVVDGNARVRTVDLERVRLGSRSANGVQYSDRAGVAVDPSGARAYVFAAGAPVAAVDLRTMALSYHGVALRVHARPDALAGERRALATGGGKIFVFGRDFVRAAGGSTAPAGAVLVDTAKWSSCVVERNGGGAALAGGKVLVYSGAARPGIGLRAYTAAGRRSFHVLGAEEVWDVGVSDGRAYAQTPTSLRIVDVSSGRVLRTIGSSVQVADVIAGARAGRPSG